MKIAILGYGTIGKGVFEISKFNEKIEVVKILERKEKFDEKYLNLFTQNIDDIINDSEIELVVEVMGGYDFALSCITKALNAKKHVVFLPIDKKQWLIYTIKRCEICASIQC